MLGSLSEAEDAVQETWLRLNRSDTGTVRDLRAWLTTVVSRVCLDMLRSRASRREDSLDDVHVPDPIVTRAGDNWAGDDPQEHAVLADSIGLALLVVLDTLSPSERLAFVLHDIFALPFEEIGQILDRSPAAAKQLASRARRRLRDAGSIESDDGDGDDVAGLTASAGPVSAGPVSAGTASARQAGGRTPGAVTDFARKRRVVEAFLAASRDGEFDRLLTILDPDVVLRADVGASALGPSQIVRGAHAVIAQAKRFAPLGRHSRPVTVNGSPGFMVVTNGEPFAVISLTVKEDRITEMDILADPERLARLDLSDVLD
ncbi:sigma-70 family RNA polymerase sigma factor [Trebonia kvetii]|uniref:Sigma-70 family RNA polymerase sigma factor n=1 Tax=Trebonia kvetii TaxID=2480626 RepID=A0A6P2BQZ2_9ACTN|nr:sigma-70 family RNA polymerase sigma factor [Trebonia kvetii]